MPSDAPNLPASEGADAQPAPRNRGLPPGRLLALADGIFAIAMTLLVFEIKLPPASGGDPWPVLLALWPKFASCGLGFLTLGFCWIGHHNQYLVIERTNRTFLWINILFLAAISFVPFSCALLGEYPLAQVAVVFYASNLLVAGSILLAHWRYATGPGRLAPGVSEELVASTARRVLVAPLAYAAVILLSLVSVGLSLGLCLLIPLAFMFRGRVDDHWEG